MSRIHATAKVLVTLEIPINGVGWGPECTARQIHEEAKADVMSQLQRLEAGKYEPSNPVLNGRWKIQGQPVVIGILTEEK